MKKSNVSRLPTRPPRAKKTPPDPKGADGRTLAQRLDIAMAYKQGQIGREYTEVHLLADANKAYGASPDAPKISQQIVNAIRRGGVVRSNFTPFLARACGVDDIWLASGIGKMLS